ncbi:MAG: hypothetical protein V1817_01500 [Candidatus Micrarchaeota archaeon]
MKVRYLFYTGKYIKNYRKQFFNSDVVSFVTNKALNRALQSTLQNPNSEKLEGLGFLATKIDHNLKQLEKPSGYPLSFPTQVYRSSVNSFPHPIILENLGLEPLLELAVCKHIVKERPELTKYRVVTPKPKRFRLLTQPPAHKESEPTLEEKIVSLQKRVANKKKESKSN